MSNQFTATKITIISLLIASWVSAAAATADKPIPLDDKAYRACRAELEKAAKAKYPDQSFPKAKPEAIEAWKDLRFGMLISWGPVTLVQKEIGWSRDWLQLPGISAEEYDNLYKRFNPVKFDADQWVNVAKAAGMKYIVLLVKHHDGFCLWNTQYTDYNIMNTPFKRDVTRELAEACRKQGIKFGIYYSVTDWYHPDYPFTGAVGRSKRPHANIEVYQQYLLNQTQELIKNYGPLLTLWYDLPWGYEGRGVETIKLARGLQPDILINGRTGSGGDYPTCELGIGRFATYPWESCFTVQGNNGWSWGGPKTGVMDLTVLLTYLVGCAGGDGNMLLNVGPDDQGEIPLDQRERVKEMGQWLARYGESIYGTRGGPYKQSMNPTGHSKTYNSNLKFACTHKGNQLYLHVLKWDGETLQLPALKAKIVKSELLTGGAVRVTQSEQGVRVHVTRADQQPLDTIVKLELDGPAEKIPPIDVKWTEPAGAAGNAPHDVGEAPAPQAK